MSRAAIVQPTDRRPRTHLTFRLEPGTATRLAQLAHRNDRSLSAELRRAIRQYLTLHEEAA